MAEAKIEMRVGEVSFSGEGAPEWLSEQLDKVIAAIPDLVKVAPKPTSRSAAGAASTPPNGVGATDVALTDTLASYIKKQKGDTVQTRRFLVTADWLRLRQAGPLSTTAVAKALSDNHQKRLSNPSECLNQNVGQGYCEKNSDGKTFYITPEGLATLGHE
jgi:hypothetical protein